jgi:hypothetical protein
MDIQYTVTLSEAENMALSYVALSQQEWIDNAVHERCRVAIEEIVKICVEKCLETNTQIPNSKNEMVILAFEQDWVKNSIQINTEI